MKTEKINVMTWNTGITENLNNHDNNFNSILNYVQEFLDRGNSIVFLQQMVYKYKKDNGEWEIHEFFNKFNKHFSEYPPFCNGHSQYYNFNEIIHMFTLALVSKGSGFERLDSFIPRNTPPNRSLAVKYKGVSFLGIHAQNGKYNDNFLNALNEAPADIILGDFNAGDYPKSENRKKFREILQQHVCICNMPTKKCAKRKTCIDHIFVKDIMVTCCSNLIVHEDITLSDHFPITFELEIPTDSDN